MPVLRLVRFFNSSVKLLKVVNMGVSKTDCYYLMLIMCPLLQLAQTMSIKSTKGRSLMDHSGVENEVVDFIVSKGYLPSDKYLPKASVVKSVDSDVTYLLSKLSDEELIKLLNDQPTKTKYDLKDMVKLALHSKNNNEKGKTNGDGRVNSYENQEQTKKRFQTLSNEGKPQFAFFRLEDKQVDPYSIKGEDPNYKAVQKLSNIFYSRPAVEQDKAKTTNEDEKKELLFDILVAQLKTLCCKKTPASKLNMQKYQTTVLNEFPSPILSQGLQSENQKLITAEQMFLIMNDEIKSNSSDELISVDPDSLENNSSVLLLGPIATPLTDKQLKIVMTRISNELSKSEYVPLLQQLSDGTLENKNVVLTRSLVTGPQTRRYIKPHRCNHQSKLAKVYGGPKWIICTGYLNLNTPSLYD